MNHPGTIHPTLWWRTATHQPVTDVIEYRDHPTLGRVAVVELDHGWRVVPYASVAQLVVHVEEVAA